MAKKFIIKDDDGKQFEVTEETIDEEPEMKKDEEPEIKEGIHDEGLTDEEIAALKSLAAKAKDILALLDVEAKEHATDVDEEVITDDEEEITDEDTCEGCGKPKDECTCDEDEKEVVVKTGDSKKSIGSIQKKKVIATDSIDDREVDIANAWADRFKKSYKKGE